MDDGNRPRGSKLRAVVWTVTLMLCSFVGGVAVGQHPQWVPLPAWVPGGAADASDATAHPHYLPVDTAGPTTQPGTAQPGMSIPQTQPAEH